MVSKDELQEKEIAIYDRNRKGIFIHKDQLAHGPFKSGDRFSLRSGQQQLFSIAIVKDDKGDIIFDQNGIFIQRTRKIDMLLGGIFEEYVVYINEKEPDEFKLSIAVEKWRTFNRHISFFTKSGNCRNFSGGRF